MADKVNNLQDIFLNSLRKSKTPVTMFLVKGVKLQGIITWFDNFSVLLRRDGSSQLVYKHAISTVMPAAPVDLAPIEKAFADSQKKPTLLQEVFLSAVRRSEEPVTMFLVNGVMLQGEVAAFDLVCLLLHELACAPLGTLHLPMPSDPRLRKIAQLIMEHPADRGTMRSWARRVGLSERTLARLLTQQTGMSFGRWRQQLHLMLAVKWLGTGASVQQVADELGYESAGGFVTMFRKALGTSPARYMAQRRAAG